MVNRRSPRMQLDWNNYVFSSKTSNIGLFIRNFITDTKISPNSKNYWSRMFQRAKILIVHFGVIEGQLSKFSRKIFCNVFFFDICIEISPSRTTSCPFTFSLRQSFQNITYAYVIQIPYESWPFFDFKKFWIPHWHSSSIG